MVPAEDRCRDRLHVAVLMGGSSEERGVSLASGCEVAAALRAAGHLVTSIDAAAGVMPAALERRIRASGIGRAEAPLARAVPANVLPEAEVIRSEPGLAEADVVFVALHGGAGEDGTVQTLLEVAGIPYSGSGPVACALAMDKDLTKRLLRDEGVATPAWIAGAAAGGEVVERLGLPVIVKPVSGGSSVRLALARSAREVDEATVVAGGGGDVVMYEAYVRGRELTVGILGGEALPVVEIEPEHELFDFRCKYEAGMAVETAPARIPDALAEALKAEALRVHGLLRMEHFSRVDFMVDGKGKAWCLEANTLPGLTGNSLLPKAGRAAGLEFPELCDRISRLGVRAGARNQARSRSRNR
ncbi:MAG: D-alanine--D-alanine ligase [Gemmatimonadota bacterium]|nr:D-alanine--D-alanine ligase [Gemmatimonadota bacterium]MDE2870587.1 D-alanine--D-alanine ligase [Gemmatimonadota bacterium]